MTNSRYHTVSNNKYRVVGVIIESVSKAYIGKQEAMACKDDGLLNFSSFSEQEVFFTYSIKWVHSPTVWATRWDKYLHVFEPRIHWFSLINSTVIVFLLILMIITILTRTLHQDISRYNQIDLSEDIQDDYGWKLVHGDVFRPPINPMIFSIFLGNGAQLIFMTGITILFSMFGLLLPSNRGVLATTLVSLYVVFSALSGYVSAAIYRNIKGNRPAMNIILTPLFIPGYI